MSRDNAEWIAGVCALNLDDPESPDLLAGFVRDYGVKTLRSVPGDERRTFDHDGVRALWRQCADIGATVDIFLMCREHAASAETLIEYFPDLKVGFCHCMDLKPGPEYDEVLRLSRFDNLVAEVDFIGTGSETGYPCEELHAAAVKIIDAYGPDRCV